MVGIKTRLYITYCLGFSIIIQIHSGWFVDGTDVTVYDM